MEDLIETAPGLEIPLDTEPATTARRICSSRRPIAAGVALAEPTLMLVKSETAEKVIGCAIEVHRSIGPGLLESAYQACLRQEFRLAGLPFEEQFAVPVRYRGAQLDCGYRLDFVVNRTLVVELKCIERTLPIHKAQVITYLRLTGLPQALLINFSVPVLRHGITSVVLNPPPR